MAAFERSKFFHNVIITNKVNENKDLSDPVLMSYFAHFLKK